MPSMQLIVPGRQCWFARRLLALPGLESIEICEISRLDEASEVVPRDAVSVLIAEVCRKTLERDLAIVHRIKARYPTAVVAAMELKLQPMRYALHEAGVDMIVISALDLQAAGDLAYRQLVRHQSTPQPQRPLRIAVRDRLPWKRHASGVELEAKN